MRKSFVMAVAVLAFGFASVQEAAAQQNMVGVKGGFVSSEISGDDIDEADFSSRTGFGFGGFLQVLVAQNVSVQPEALYLSKGVSEEGGDGEIKVNYLQVPILVQYHIPAGGVSPRVFAGPSIAFELGCDFSEDGVEVACEDLGLDTKSADFGLVLGAGVDIPAGGVIVTLDGRYDMGVTEIAEEDGVNLDAKNKAWELFAGVGFPFGP